jgi:drug/metabolite transporter (DMT)-like permease
MRSLNEQSITAWMTLFLLLLLIPVIYLNKPSSDHSLFYFMEGFDLQSWVVSFLFGVTGVYSQTTRARALHYEDSSKLGVMLFFQSVIQLIMDVVFLGTAFTGQQVWGVAIIFVANGIKWATLINKSFFQPK